jgi:hypothetical protein
MKSGSLSGGCFPTSLVVHVAHERLWLGMRDAVMDNPLWTPSNNSATNANANATVGGPTAGVSSGGIGRGPRCDGRRLEEIRCVHADMVSPSDQPPNEMNLYFTFN